MLFGAVAIIFLLPMVAGERTSWRLLGIPMFLVGAACIAVGIFVAWKSVKIAREVVVDDR